MAGGHCLCRSQFKKKLAAACDAYVSSPPPARWSQCFEDGHSILEDKGQEINFDRLSGPMGMGNVNRDAYMMWLCICLVILSDLLCFYAVEGDTTLRAFVSFSHATSGVQRPVDARCQRFDLYGIRGPILRLKCPIIVFQ